jgi:hypothetical protein
MKLTDEQRNKLQNNIDRVLDNRPNSEKLSNLFELFVEQELEEMPEPIGNFIIDNAKGVMGADGMYYHYTEVIKLLKLRDKKNEKG